MTDIVGPPCVGAPIRATLDPIGDLSRLEADWRMLEGRAAPSFFHSWDWIGRWLRSIPPDLRLEVGRVERAGRVVGLGLFVRRWARSADGLPLRRLLLHECGTREVDALTTEYNGLLVEIGCEAPALEALFAALARATAGWDEIVLGGVDNGSARAHVDAARVAGLQVSVLASSPVTAVDLDVLRRTGRPLAAGLGASTRAQLRRSLRLYAALGEVGLRAAASVDEALGMFARLEVMHQRSWQRRGRSGCFADPVFGRFHRELIRDSLTTGAVRLVEARAGAETIGVLYGFAAGRRLLAYQSGFDYRADGRFKPGLVTHALAIEAARNEGFAVYDFMAGANRLKTSLGQPSGRMLRLALRRPRWDLGLRTRFAHIVGRSSPWPVEPAERSA